MKNKLIGPALRKKRVRGKIRGTKARPRLSVFRSNKYVYGQIIDDDKGVTLAGASEKEIKEVKSGKHKSKNKSGLIKTERAKMVGALLGEKALKAGIKKVVFDRGSYRYLGRIKALADGARQAGLKF